MSNLRGSSGQEERPGATTIIPPSSSSIASSPVLAATPDPALTAALDSIWAESGDACLRVTAGGVVLYDAAPERSLMPASVTKLATGAVALEVLGTRSHLRTVVRSASPAVEGVVRGDLWLVGGGDPVLMTDAWAAGPGTRAPLHTSLDALADRVVAAGIRRIEGAVIGDESRHDEVRHVPSWPTRLVADGEIGPLSALMVNDGFRVPGHPGVPFADPPVDAAAVFAELLAARGVTIAEPPSAGPAPMGAMEVAAIDSPEVGEIVHAMLRDSDNGSAELLLKEVGRAGRGTGSTEAGAAVVEDVLARSRVDIDGVVIADGSGLSDAGRLTCRATTDLLAAKAGLVHDRVGIAGVDGTLARRYLGTPAAGRVRGKTGSIRGVLALAGYAQTADGSTLEFAYVINGDAARRGGALQDRLASALVAAP